MVERTDIVEPCKPSAYPQITMKQAVAGNEDQTLYVACGTHLHALNAGTGVIRWGLSIRMAPRKFPSVPAGVFISMPAPLDGLRGVAVWQDRAFVTSRNSFCYALSAKDGAIIWRHDIGYASGTPVVVGETMYISMGAIYALNVNDGTERWVFQTKDVVSSPPVIVGDTLYTGSYDNRIYALNSENGQPRWTYQTEGRVYVDPIVDHGTLYAGAGNGGIRLLVLDAESGKLKWQMPSLLDVRGQLLLHDGLLYTCYREHLVGLNPENGRPAWRYPDVKNASLLSSKHVLYVAADSGDLYAFEGSKPRLLWRLKLRALAAGQLCRLKLLGDELYVGFNEYGGMGERYASVHAVNTLTGNEDWSTRVTWSFGSLDLD